MNIQLPLSPALIALLPSALDFLEWLLDRAGLLGGKFIRAKLATDNRDFISENFVKAYGREANLRAIETYFNFEETAGDIIKRHLSFLLSIYFVAVEASHDLLKVEGWPIIGLAAVLTSLIVFLLLFLNNRWSGAAEHPLRQWTMWTWVIFLVIGGIEAWEHFP
jgi:hypothetical protein